MEGTEVIAHGIGGQNPWRIFCGNRVVTPVFITALKSTILTTLTKDCDQTM